MVSTSKAVLAALFVSAPVTSGFAGFSGFGGFDDFGYMPLPTESKKAKAQSSDSKKTAAEDAAIKAAEQAKIEHDLKMKNQEIVKDSAALSYGNSVFRKKLEKNGIYIDDRGCKDFKLETPEGSYVFKEIAKLERGDFKARSMAIHKVDKDGVVDKEPSSVSITFGGSSKFTDIPKKLATSPVKFPFNDDFLVKEMIRRTRYNFYYDYSKSIADKDVDLSVSAYAGDCKLGMSCQKELHNQGIESQLNLYEHKAPKITTGLVGAALMAGAQAYNLATIASAAIDGEYNSDVSRVSDVKMFDSPSHQTGRGLC